MPEHVDAHPSTALSTLPGAEILLRTRGLLLSALGAALVYAFVTNASKGHCPGGSTGGGGFLDADGLPTDVPPSCIALTLQPSVLVYVAIGVLVLSAISRVLSVADSEAAAIRILDRARVVIIAVVAASVLISHVWFWLIPIDDWTGTGAFLSPFPFGSVSQDISPIQG